MTKHRLHIHVILHQGNIYSFRGQKAKTETRPSTMEQKITGRAKDVDRYTRSL